MFVAGTISRDFTHTITSETRTIRNELARRVYQAAEVLQKPLYFFCNGIIGRLMTVSTPKQFGNFNNSSLEVIRRIALVCISPAIAGAAIVGSPLAAMLNFIGDSLLDKPYLSFLGTYTGEKKETFATFNMSTLLPPMTLIDGVDDSQSRLNALANEVRDFHFFCGQEVDGSSAMFFANALKQDFKEFYTYLGKSNTPLIPSGLFFACKEKVLAVSIMPFKGPVQKAIKRELVVFELADFCVATMHLDGGDGDNLAQIHLTEIQQATEALSQCKKPIIFCGDFNEDRYHPSEAYQAFATHFVDCIAQQRPNEQIITCTNAFKIQRFGSKASPTKESVDYIAYNKDQQKLTVEFIDAEHFSELSDHSLIKGKICLIPEKFSS